MLLKQNHNCKCIKLSIIGHAKDTIYTRLTQKIFVINTCTHVCLQYIDRLFDHLDLNGRSNLADCGTSIEWNSKLFTTCAIPRNCSQLCYTQT